MKLITKTLDIEGRRFAIVEGELNGRRYFGTIPHSNIDFENGRVVKEISGAGMCIEENIARAIESRQFQIATEGMTLEQIVEFAKTFSKREEEQ